MGSETASPGPSPTGTPGSTPDDGSGGAGSSPTPGATSTPDENDNGGGSGGQGPGPTPPPEATPVGPSGIDSTRLARLTHEQYQNTVAELFGITDRVADVFAPDALNGFDFDSSLDFLVDARLGPQYRDAAEQLAERAVTDNAIFNRIVPCNATDAGCAAEFIAEFGQRALRRPLTTAEAERFAALFAEGANLVQSGNAFRDGVRVVVEAMLQTPQFLYRVELSSQPDDDGFIPLSGWEVASRLSYFLWNSMPDDALFEQARRDELQTPAQIASAVNRMLADPRAQQTLVNFHEQAWHFNRFARIAPDRAIYPDVPNDMAERVGVAARSFITEVLQNGGGITELLTARYAYADAALAPLYGVDVAGDYERIDFANGERRGFLMQLGFLASNAYAIKTDPIHRGLFIQRDLLCRVIPDPPDNASTAEPPETDTPPQTTREEVSLLTSPSECAACHDLINPPGFAFEGFDAAGRARTTENDVQVDTSGQLLLSGGNFVSFSGAAELVELLANSDEVRACYTSKLMTFALGRPLSPADRAFIETLTETHQSTRDLAMEIAQSRVFRTRFSAVNPAEVNP